MSLLEKKSLYDRNNRNTLGTNVGTSAPSQGNYYAEDGQNMNSPFITKDGPVEDHLKTLLETDVTSQNTGITYLKSPSKSPFQDLNTSPDPTTYSGQLANPTLGQFGGPYKNVGPTDGFY
jgi:hypothetical protein